MGTVKIDRRVLAQEPASGCNLNAVQKDAVRAFLMDAGVPDVRIKFANRVLEGVRVRREREAEAAARAAKQTEGK